MKKLAKLGVFGTIVLVLIGMIILKSDFSLGEKVYIVSEEENKNEDKEEMLNINNNDIDKNNSDIVKKEDNVDEQEIESPKGITIYISGAIKNPGILTIDKEKRLYDAIEELGGVTEEADLNRVNLALKLSDEQHYIIPKIGEEIQVADNSAQGASTQESNNNQSKLININLATLEELDNLPGVGEATANKIINYREENSSFKSIEEIKNVNGIGDKKYEDLKDLICTNWQLITIIYI